MQAAASIALLLMSVMHAAGNGAAAESDHHRRRSRRRVQPHRRRHSLCRTIRRGRPGLPQAPAPKLTEPLVSAGHAMSIIRSRRAISGIRLRRIPRLNVPAPRLGNTDRLESLLRDGKIYLSLADAVTLALENNYDIAIARINLDIADTDILRAKAGSTSSRCLDRPGAEYAGRNDADDSRRRRTGRDFGGSGRRRRGRGRNRPEHERRRTYCLSFATRCCTGTMQYETLAQPQLNTLFSGGQQVLNTNTGTYNFTYQPGICDRHAAYGRLQQLAGDDEQPVQQLQPVDHDWLSRDGDPASAAGIWPGA